MAQELVRNGGAVYLFDKVVGEKIIIVHEEKDIYHAFRGRCRHKEKTAHSSGILSTCCNVNDGARDKDDFARKSIPRDCFVLYPVSLIGNTLKIDLSLEMTVK